MPPQCRPGARRQQRHRRHQALGGALLHGRGGPRLLPAGLRVGVCAGGGGWSRGGAADGKCRHCRWPPEPRLRAARTAQPGEGRARRGARQLCPCPAGAHPLHQQPCQEERAVLPQTWPLPPPPSPQTPHTGCRTRPTCSGGTSRRQPSVLQCPAPRCAALTPCSCRRRQLWPCAG